MKKPSGRFLSLEGERFFRMDAYDCIPSFLMNIVSDGDLWLFVSSNGGITGGRESREKAVFPYVTADKLTDNAASTGGLTLVRTGGGGKGLLWQAFPPVLESTPKGIRRALYKNLSGTRVLFEEINLNIGLRVRIEWTTSDRFGIIRRTVMTNMSSRSVSLSLLDGVRNILPAGVGFVFQNTLSNLADAYKWNERIRGSSLAVYSLNAATTDRAEPMESLRATAVWSVSRKADLLLSEAQLPVFRRGGGIRPESLMTGWRGAYLLHIKGRLGAGESLSNIFVIDAELSQSRVAGLRDFLASCADPAGILEEEMRRTSENVRRIVAGADGLQQGNREMVVANHFANTLYNILRGGVPAEGYAIPLKDFERFVSFRNRACHQRQKDFFDRLGPVFDRRDLMAAAQASSDTDLLRLALEYIPVAFGRRHGDPSRPWNLFNIRVRESDGSPILNYQGNWRDIFQNWEALFLSYPAWFENATAKFLNAMTPDGYNPYRIGRKGLDWEIMDPADPWSHIGYWGDHQVVYLHRLLLWLDGFFPGRIAEMMDRQIFSFARLPYRIVSWDEIRRNPRHTILFDPAEDREIRKKADISGSDACLMTDGEERVIHATFMEKILVILLAKCANFVAGGGIWMNTQRPEWNDANNALAGIGVSMVTLCQLRAFAVFLRKRIPSSGSHAVCSSVRGWFDAVRSALREEDRRTCSLRDEERGRLLDRLERAASSYRDKIYRGCRGGEAGVDGEEVRDFLGLCIAWFDETIRLNEREDGLFHAYNILNLSGGEDGIFKAGIGRLGVMLEGQVAVIASGFLNPARAVRLLASLRKSRLYAADRKTYLLYPVCSFAGYLERNLLSAEQVRSSELIVRLLEEGDHSLVTKDSDGVRFAPEAVNAEAVERILDGLESSGQWTGLVVRERELMRGLYESVFMHGSFTGRSQVIFAYEGSGSVYWHMVAKLLLAVQEAGFEAEGREKEELKRAYREIEAGLGYEKSPGEFGAFPQDPYSHTPEGRGAQQPGMTGQVKEQIVCRLAENGIRISRGRIVMDPFFMDEKEFSSHAGIFRYVDSAGLSVEERFSAGEKLFTFCQTLFLIRKARRDRVRIFFSDGTVRIMEASVLDAGASREIFLRTGKVVKVDVEMEIKGKT